MQYEFFVNPAFVIYGIVPCVAHLYCRSSGNNDGE